MTPVYVHANQTDMTDMTDMIIQDKCMQLYLGIHYTLERLVSADVLT